MMGRAGSLTIRDMLRGGFAGSLFDRSDEVIDVDAEIFGEQGLLTYGEKAISITGFKLLRRRD
jgi:hypothetical protein